MQAKRKTTYLPKIIIINRKKKILVIHKKIGNLKYFLCIYVY